MTIVSAVMAAALAGAAANAAPQDNPPAPAPAQPSPPPAAQATGAASPPATAPDSASASPAPAAAAPTAPPSSAATGPQVPAAPPAGTRAANVPGSPPEIVVSGRGRPPKQDPLVRVNEKTFAVTEAVDDKFIAPVAHTYRSVLPLPLRLGLHNFFFNLNEPVNFVNYVLQVKPVSAARTFARFTINTTIGVAGVMDVAKKKPFNIHYRPNGVGNTLGYYGIGPGPYMFLPLVGPTTLRDVLGTFADQLLVPFSAGGFFDSPYYVLAAGAVQGLDYRVIIDDDLSKVRKSDRPYANYRQIYLKTRHDEIEALHGRGPLAKGEVGMAPFAKPLVPATGPSPVAPVQLAPQPVAPPTPPPAAEATPPAPPARVFVSQPVVEPLPNHP